MIYTKIDFLGSLGDITKFKKLPDGWVRWELINRDFGPVSKSSWHKAKEVADKEGFRLGKRIEHELLYHAFKENPDIKREFFPNGGEWYWTEEEYSFRSAWCVNVSYGDVVNDNMDNHGYVRPCRASQ